MSKTTHTLFRYASFKKKNKRVNIGAYTDDKDGEISIIVDARQLIGSWKDRNIKQSKVVYGLETFMLLAQVFDMLTDDHLFRKLSNRELGQIQKEKLKGTTDIGT